MKNAELEDIARNRKIIEGDYEERQANLIYLIREEDSQWEEGHLQELMDHINSPGESGGTSITGNDFLVYMLKNQSNRDKFPQKVLWGDDKEMLWAYDNWKLNYSKSTPGGN